MSYFILKALIVLAVTFIALALINLKNDDHKEG